MSAAALTLGALVEVRDFLRTSRGTRFLSAFTADYNAKRRPDGRGRSGADLASVLVAGLGVAESFHVQPQMMPLLRWAAATLPASASYLMTQLPAQSGFALLAEPYPVTDLRGDVSCVGALSWQRQSTADGEGGVLLCWWADASQPSDSAHQRWVEMGSKADMRLSLLHTAEVPFGTPIGEATAKLDDQELQRWAATGDAPSSESSENALRLPLALFNLLGQHVVVSAAAHLSAGAVRAWARKHVVPEVEVVHLRAAAPRPGEAAGAAGEGARRLTRWIVRGHWRQQAYGPGYGLQRLIWIAPHLAGDEDAPLSLKTKVYDLAR